MTAHVRVEVDPTEVGMDAGRLRRIDTHFERWVADGRLAGWTVLVSRRGRVVHLSSHGLRDAEAGLPVEHDTLWRVYSMTKPVTSVAAMSLHEEGAFSLTDEIARWLPEFRDVRVWKGGTPTAPQTVPAVEPLRVWHLLTHTAGLTYGFMHAHPVDAIYRAAGFDILSTPGLDLAGATERWAGLPLLFQPGTEWAYSVATDVLGRFLEVVTGQLLDRVLADRVLEPCGMTDTHWWVRPEDAGRLAALYQRDPATGGTARVDVLGKEALSPPALLSGGGGLISTVTDQHRFTQMLLAGGASPDGRRVLGPRTLAFMTRNHLHGGADLASFGRGQFAETAYAGVGFGLGFGVMLDPLASEVLCSPGEFTWGGLASTAFWVDPLEEVTCVFLTQLLPSSTYPIRPQLRSLVYQSIVD